MSAAFTIAAYGLRESLRRRVFTVVLVLSVAFLGLYAFGTEAAFDQVAQFGDPQGRETVIAGSTLLGLAMFATLFLGTVLATFLTLSTVRGDAERGLLQPLVVRPLGRPALLLGRFLGAAAVCAVYVAVLYSASVAIIASGRLVSEGRPKDLARPRGVEVETATGTRLIREAGRDDAPRIVSELVAAGEEVYGVRVLSSTLEEVYLEAVQGETS